MLCKVTFEYGGPGGVRHRIGEVVKLGKGSHLLAVGYAEEIEGDVDVAECGCGRMFAAPVHDVAEHLRAHREQDGCDAKLGADLAKLVKAGAPKQKAVVDTPPVQKFSQTQSETLERFEIAVKKIVTDSGGARTIDEAIEEMATTHPELHQARCDILAGMAKKTKSGVPA